MLDLRKRFFTKRIADPWNMLHKKVVTAPDLSEFRKHLDSTVRYMG